MNRRDTIKAAVSVVAGPGCLARSARIQFAPRPASASRTGDAPVTPDAFGAVGDGVADDTVALQSAVDAAAAARRPFQLSPVDYRVTGTVTVSTDHFHWIQPQGAVVLCGNASGPAI